MAALHSCCGYYILVLFFLSLFPRLISAVADWMSTILVLVNDFNVYQRVLLILVAVSVIDFCPAVFYTVRALVALKVWRSWHLLKCHRFLTFVYKNRHFVSIYSEVIPR